MISNTPKHIRLYYKSLRQLLLILSARNVLHFSNKDVSLPIIHNLIFYVKPKNLANI